jgi:hypothetical protein
VPLAEVVAPVMFTVILCDGEVEPSSSEPAGTPKLAALVVALVFDIILVPLMLVILPLSVRAVCNTSVAPVKVKFTPVVAAEFVN